MTMLTKLLDGTPDGIAWFADQAPLHATALLDILRGLERPTPNVIALRLEAQVVINKMASAYDDGVKQEESDAQYWRDVEAL